MKSSVNLTADNLRNYENLHYGYGRPKKNPESASDNSERFFPYSQTSLDHQHKKKITKNNLLKSLPLVAIVATAFGVIILFNYISSPLVTLARLATDTLNTQDLAIDNRMNQLLDYKLNNSPDEPVKYQVLADYRKIEPKLVKELQKEGIELNQQTKTATFQQKKIDGDQLLVNINSDLKLNKAINDATAIRRYTFHDNVWNGYKQQTKLTQVGIISDNTKKSVQEQELELTKSNNSSFRFSVKKSESDDDINGIANNLTKLNQSADHLQKNSHTPNGQSFDNLIFIDKPNDSCSLYQTAKATQNYQKTAQAEQLSKLAALMLSEADKIKSGYADSEVANYLNNRLTYSGTYVDGSGQTQYQRSAMDSYAQRFLSGNNIETPDSSAQKYVIGINEPLAKTTEILKQTGGTENCDEVGVWADFKNFFTNIWGFLTNNKPEESVNQHLTDQVKLNTTSTNLSAMTGLATAPDFSGEDLANGFTSGVAELMSKSAQKSGLTVLTKSQAIAYLGEQQNLIARRAEIDRQNLSPFDSKSPYTFLGSTLLQFSTITAKSGLLNQLMSINRSAVRSIALLTKPAMANNNQIAQNLEMCYDKEYLQANPDIALGPYCNLVYGVATTSLTLSPESVVNNLVKSGDLQIIEDSCDGNGNYCQLETANKLKEFEENCVNRQTPIGIEGELNNSGENCVAKTKTEELFSVYLLDQRVNQNLKREPYQNSNRPTGLSQTITLDMLHNYTLSKSADKIAQILSVIQGPKALYQNGPGRGSVTFTDKDKDGNEIEVPYNQACDRFALHHARGLEGRFNEDFSGMNIKELIRYSHGSGGNVDFITKKYPMQGPNVANNPSKRDVLNDIYKTVKSGHVCVIVASQKDDPDNKKGRHFVTVIGFDKKVQSPADLRESDLLIIDSANGKLQDFGKPGARYLHRGRSDSWWTNCAQNR